MAHVTSPFAPLAAARRRGLVLPLVLIVMAVAIILGMCFLTSASTATTLSAAADHRLRARMIAESGLAMMLAYVETDGNWRTDRINGQWMTNQALDGGTFSASGEDGGEVTADGVVVGDGDLADDAADPVLLTSVGVYKGARHRVRLVRSPPSVGGLGVSERAEFRNKVTVDSYNADAGPYSLTTATANATVMSNGDSRRRYILLRDKSKVNGDVYFAPGGKYAKAVEKASTATVTGTFAALPGAVLTAPIVEPDWLALSGPRESYSSGLIIMKNDRTHAYDRFELKGTAKLRVIGDVKMYVDGNFVVTDTASIEIGAPAPYAAAVKTTILLQAGTRVDSYDSSVAPYDAASTGSGPLLATNQTSASSISVEGLVAGDALSGAGSSAATAITTVGSGLISGDRRAIFASLTFPTPLSPPSLTIFPDVDVPQNGAYPITTNMQVARFRAAAGATITVSANCILRVTEEFRIEGATLNILAGSSLMLHVANAMRIEGTGAKLNAAGKDPSKFIIHASSSAVEHVISGDAEVYAMIEVPVSSLKIDGTAQLFGAFMGNALTLAGSGQLHLDRNPAVAAAHPRMSLGYQPGSKLTVHVNNKLLIQKSARINVNTTDPRNLSIYHHGPMSMEVKESAVAYAQAFVPEMLLYIGGLANWTGRILARDFTMTGSAVVTVDGTGGTASPGIVVEETIKLEDSAEIKSTAGAALLASHGACDTTIRIRGTSSFGGDAYTGPGGNPSHEIRVSSDATLTGKKRGLTVPVDISASPQPLITVSTSDKYVTGSTTFILPEGDVYFRKFRAEDSALVKVEGTTRLILTNDFEFRENARLVLSPGASLTIYCPRDVVMSGYAELNIGGHPRQVVIHCSPRIGTGVDEDEDDDDDEEDDDDYESPDLELKSRAKFCGTILAPLAELEVEDRAELFGSFRGKRLQVEDEAKVHCAASAPGAIMWIEHQ